MSSTLSPQTHHLDSSTERELAVTLGEVQVTDSEIGPVDVDGEVAAGSAAEVLDVDITTVLASGNRASALGIDLLADLVGEVLADIRALGGGRKSDLRAAALVGRNELALALVPLVQQLLRGHGTDQSGVWDAGEADARDVTRRGVDALKVPDSLGRLRVELVGEETTAVRFCDQLATDNCLTLEDARVAPLHVREGGDVEDVHDEHIASLSSLNGNGTAEVVDLGEIDILFVSRTSYRPRR